jgi:hypothetical protein
MKLYCKGDKLKEDSCKHYCKKNDCDTNLESFCSAGTYEEQKTKYNNNKEICSCFMPRDFYQQFDDEQYSKMGASGKKLVELLKASGVYGGYPECSNLQCKFGGTTIQHSTFKPGSCPNINIQNCINEQATTNKGTLKAGTIDQSQANNCVQSSQTTNNQAQPSPVVQPVVQPIINSTPQTIVNPPNSTSKIKFNVIFSYRRSFFIIIFNYINCSLNEIINLDFFSHNNIKIMNVIAIIVLIVVVILSAIVGYIVTRPIYMKARWVMVTNTKNKGGNGNENFLDFAEIYVYDKNNVNVALKKPVKTYTIYGNSNINNFVDGNEATIGHTKNEDEVEWLRIDLGSEIELKKIVIVGRKDCCQGRMKGYRIALYGGDIAPTLSTTPISISNFIGEISPNNVYAWDVTSSIEKSVDTKYPPQYIHYSHNYLHY